MTKFKTLFFLTVLLTIFLRTFRLASVPAGFANDEAAITYQSYSILQTGKDTWGKPFPILSFKDFGEYLPPFSVYALVPFIKILGLNEFSARLPSALTAIIAIFAIYILTKNLFGNRYLSLLACFLFAISPFNIGWSRFVYEGNFGALLYLLGITCFVSSRKNSRYLIASVIFFGATLATYHIYFVVTPITLVALVFSRIKMLYKLDRKIIIICFVLLTSFALYGMLIIASGSGRERFRQVSIFSRSDVLDRINNERKFCKKELPDIACVLFYNKMTAYSREYLHNYLTHLSPTYLALDATFLRGTLLPKTGLVYIFELPFLIIAAASLLIRRDFAAYLLLFWLAIFPLANSFTGVGEISRIGHIMPLLPILSALGIFKFRQIIKNLKYEYIFFIIIGILALYNILNFLITYFVVFPKTNAHFGSYSYVVLFKEVRTKYNYFDRYFITRDYTGSSPEYQARIFLPIDPLAFQTEDRRQFTVKEPQGYYDYKRLDNFYFFSSRDEVNPQQGDLLIVSKSQLEENDKILFEIKEPNGDISLIAVTK